MAAEHIGLIDAANSHAKDARIAELEKENAALWTTIATVEESRNKLIAAANSIPREISVSETVSSFHKLYEAIEAFVDETNPDR